MKVAASLLLITSLFHLARESAHASAVGEWDTHFTLPPGLNGSVWAMISVGDFLYVGGNFSKVGSIPARGVAKWDGTNWSTLGTGVNGPVMALAASGTNIYVGGQFDAAGLVAATNIARWDGSTWHSVGGGLYSGEYSIPMVSALHVDSTNLFVGGNFLFAGGVSMRNIARWDGSQWHALDDGAGLPDGPYDWGCVFSIVGTTTNLYAGGVFIHAGNVVSTNLAHWNGNAWNSIGNSFGGNLSMRYQGNDLSGRILTLAMHDNLLFVGGDFHGIDGIQATNFACWDGTNWLNKGNFSGGVAGLEQHNGSLFVSGTFTAIDGLQATNMAILSNGTWTPFHIITHRNGYPFRTLHHGSQFYAGGEFWWANDISAGNMLRWNGTNWSAFETRSGNSLGGQVESLATDGTNAYAAGWFWTAGTNQASGLAKWDGTNWSPVGTLVDGEGTAVAVIKSNIYFCGRFVIPEIGATNFARWNGSSWFSVQGPDSREIHSREMLVVNEVLYVEGSFWNSSNSIFGCAAWDGTNWSFLPWNGGYETSLAANQTHLYLAGTEGTNGKVGRWDGTNLSLLGSLPAVRPTAIALKGTNVYVSGSLADNISALFSLDGDIWTQMPMPTTNLIFAMLGVRDVLYVSTIGSPHGNTVFAWNGSEWSSLGGAFLSGNRSGYVQSMVSMRRKIFFGGMFTAIDALDSGNVAVWNEAPEIFLKNLRFQENNTFAFDLIGIPGDRLAIEASGTLEGWSSIGSITLQVEQETFSESQPIGTTNRFFRAKWLK